MLALSLEYSRIMIDEQLWKIAIPTNLRWLAVALPMLAPKDWLFCGHKACQHGACQHGACQHGACQHGEFCPCYLIDHSNGESYMADRRPLFAKWSQHHPFDWSSTHVECWSCWARIAVERTVLASTKNVTKCNSRQGKHHFSFSLCLGGFPVEKVKVYDRATCYKFWFFLTSVVLAFTSRVNARAPFHVFPVWDKRITKEKQTVMKQCPHRPWQQVCECVDDIVRHGNC